MLIDILYAIIVIIALIKGFRQGLIIALFSVVAFIVGLAAAMKLSAVVAEYMRGSINVSAKWLPFLSFALVFIVVVLLIRWGASLLQKAVELTLLGWVNRLGGMILYFIFYTIAFSVILFFCIQMHFISQDTIDKSVIYPFVEPWGPAVLDTLGSIIPWFKDMFKELEEFFSDVSKQIPPK
jgi:membrane protein required for colicin V production